MTCKYNILFGKQQPYNQFLTIVKLINYFYCFVAHIDAPMVIIVLYSKYSVEVMSHRSDYYSIIITSHFLRSLNFIIVIADLNINDRSP